VLMFRLFLLVVEMRVLGENHRPTSSNWQTYSCKYSLFLVYDTLISYFIIFIWRRICSARPTHNPALLSLSFFMTYHMIFNRSNKTGPTSGAGIAYPIPIFSGGRVAQSLVFCMIFCWSVLVFFWVHFLLAMVHLWFTASYYPFTIFEHLLYLVDNPHLCEKYYNRQLVPLYQMIQEISFQLINIYSISGQNRIWELLWHQLLQGWCASDVDSENF